MRHLVIAAVVAASLGSLGSGTASAYCDPKYWPLCTNDCKMQPPDLSNPPSSLFRACPE